jgi:hypothetical protein
VELGLGLGCSIEAPIDPLPRRHPTHAHSYSQDNCPTCEHIYAPDEGPRAGRHFLFAAADIASLLMGVGRGDPIREGAAQTRRDALRFRPPSASHRGLAYEPTPEDLAWLASVASYDDLGHGYYAIETEGTDWDVRFRRGLGEDDYVSDDWEDRTDKPPSDVELLRSYAESIAPERGAAVAMVLPSPAEMVDDDRFLSNSFALGAEYVDGFGPAVVAPFYVKEWPESIVVDSQPVRRRALVGDEAARVASDFLCEIFGVQDGISKELILLYPAGGKDQESIKEVFSQKTGIPKWIVTDGESAMPKAIAAAFPGIIHYRCEEHLRDDAMDAAARDRVRDPEVLAAIETAQYTPAHWERLKAIAAARIDLVHSELRTWIASNEALVLHQYELRRLHPRYPRSTGGVEGPLGSVRRDLDVRRVALRNRRRLVIVLELMRVALIHKARPERSRRSSASNSRLVASGGWIGSRTGTTRSAHPAASRRFATRSSSTATWPAGRGGRRPANAPGSSGGAAKHDGACRRQGLRRAAPHGALGLLEERGHRPSHHRGTGQPAGRLGMPEARGWRSGRPLAGSPARVAPAAWSAGPQEPRLPVLYAPSRLRGEQPPNEPPAAGPTGRVGLRDERPDRRHARQQVVWVDDHRLVAVRDPRPLPDGDLLSGPPRPGLRALLAGGRAGEAA